MIRRKIYVSSGAYDGYMVIRFVVCNLFSIQEDIRFAWDEITNQTTEVMKANLSIDDINLKMKDIKITNNHIVIDEELNDHKIIQLAKN